MNHSEIESFDAAFTALNRGVSLLEASAGTGKTYTLARIFLRLIAEEGVEIGRILAVTFTVAATDELKTRIRSMLQEASKAIRSDHSSNDRTFEKLRQREDREMILLRIRIALNNLDEAAIYTIHGFCHRVLTDYALEADTVFDAELLQESQDLAREAMEEFWRKVVASENPITVAVAFLAKSRISVENHAYFFDHLPNQADLVKFGFEDGNRTVEQELLQVYNELRQYWDDHGDDYLEYVGTCLNQRLKVAKNRELHGEILDSFFGESGVSPAGLEILQEIAGVNPKPKKAYEDWVTPEFFELAQRFVAKIVPYVRGLSVQAIDYARTKVEHWKGERAILTYNDLLSVTGSAVSNIELFRMKISEQYSAALIDEFQDTDPIQYQIFKTLFGNGLNHWLFFIGDPKQSIYRFRGADLNAYFKFLEESQPRKYSLDTNYRSVSKLIDAVNGLFLNVENPFLYQQLEFRPVDSQGASHDKKHTFYWRDSSDSVEEPAPLVLRSLPEDFNQTEAQRAITTDLCNEVIEILNDGMIGGRPVQPKDIAILTRTNWRAKEIWNALGQSQIPAVVYSDISLFAGDEAQELLWVLEGIVKCRDERSIKRSIGTPLLAGTVELFEEFQQNPAKWELWVDRFRNYLHIWQEQGVFITLNTMFRECKVLENNLQRPDGERRVTNLLHLADVLQDTNSKNPMTPSALCNWLRGQIAHPNAAVEEYQLRLESESDAIKVITAHKSKGLEFPIVFLPDLYKVPKGKDAHYGPDVDFNLKYQGGSGQQVIGICKEDEEGKKKALLEEEREDARVFYVAITRAVSRCYIYHLTPESNSGLDRISAQSRIIESLQSNGGLPQGPDDDAGDQTIGDSGDTLPNLSFSCIDGIGGVNVYTPDSGSSENSPDLSAANWTSNRVTLKSGLIASFSVLVKSVSFEGRDLDSVSEPTSEEESTDLEPHSIFKFRAGAQAGNFLHELFENVDFDDDSGWAEMVQQLLEKHNFEEVWQTTMEKMLGNVTEANLQPGLSLKNLSQKDRLNEMSFHYSISSADLLQLTQTLPDGDVLKSYLEQVRSKEGYQFRIGQESYMKGAIDLLFRHGDKYYILDWKSNTLGGDLSKFSKEGLFQEMCKHGYILQYYIYTLAVHRYLKTRVKDYEYNEHFGGAFYLFVRGMEQTGDRGVYFDLPSLEAIEQLDAVIG